MQKSLSSINGISSIVLTSPCGPGVVIITDAKRTGVPVTIEKGAHFSVYPFGQECGVMICHTRFNRAAVQYASGTAHDAEPVNQSDEQILMRAAQHYLAEAELRCAEFDPRLADATDLPLPNRVVEDGSGADRLAAAREFNRIIGEKLHRKHTTVEAKKKQRALAKIQRKAEISATARRNRERKLVHAIAQFRRIPGGPSYLHYLQLQVRGAGDVFSQMDDASIMRRSGPAHVLEVRRWLGDTVEIAAALRWILRGLSPNMAIRKVIADVQERALANVGTSPARTASNTYRRVF